MRKDYKNEITSERKIDLQFIKQFVSLNVQLLQYGNDNEEHGRKLPFAIFD